MRKNLTVKVRFLDRSIVVRKLRAPAGKLLTDKGVDQVLEQLAGQIEAEFPDQEFRLVLLRDGNFNFVEVAAEQTSLRELELRELELRVLYGDPSAPEPQGLLRAEEMK